MRLQEFPALATMLEEHLEVPFETTVFDVPVIVRRVDITQPTRSSRSATAVAIDRRFPILSLPLPVPRLTGWEWIEAYRRWAQGWRR